MLMRQDTSMVVVLQGLDKNYQEQRWVEEKTMSSYQAKRKIQTHVYRKNTTYLGTVFQPFTRPVSNQEDMKWYLCVNKRIDKS